MSSHRPKRAPIPLYPVNLYQPQEELPSDDHAKGELPSDEYSDFPPIQEHKSNLESDSLHSPTDRFHPHSSVDPEQCSSPTLSEPSPSQPTQYSRPRQRNKGLGQKNILNTVEIPTDLIQRYPKVSDGQGFCL